MVFGGRPWAPADEPRRSGDVTPYAVRIDGSIEAFQDPEQRRAAAARTPQRRRYELLQVAARPGRRRDIAWIVTLGEGCEHRLEDRPARRGSARGLVQARTADGRAQLPGQSTLRARQCEGLP